MPCAACGRTAPGSLLVMRSDSSPPRSRRSTWNGPAQAPAVNWLIAVIVWCAAPGGNRTTDSPPDREPPPPANPAPTTSVNGCAPGRPSGPQPAKGLGEYGCAYCEASPANTGHRSAGVSSAPDGIVPCRVGPAGGPDGLAFALDWLVALDGPAAGALDGGLAAGAPPRGWG